jgi:hypothetical protein
MEGVSTSSVPSRPSITGQESVRLSLSFQAPSVRQAVDIAAGLRTNPAHVVHVRSPRPRVAGRHDWIVTLTTPALPLTMAVIQTWESEMLAVERRWPGCRFLGWRIPQEPCPSIGCSERELDRDDADAAPRRSQRELVLASLLRRPPGLRAGIVHGRAIPR